MPIFDMIFSTPLPSALIRLRTAFSGVTPVSCAGADELLDGLHREVRVHRGGAVADQQRDVVDLAHVAGLDDQADLHPVLVADEVVVDRRDHQQARHGRELAARVAVGEHDELRAALDRRRRPRARIAAMRSSSARSPSSTRYRPRTTVVVAVPGAASMCMQLRELVVVDHREVEHDLAGVLRRRREQVALGPEAELQGGDDLLADRVERRVRHLRELLHEVVEQQPRPLRQDRDRGVGAHRAERLGALLPHRAEQDPDLLLRVAEGALAALHGGGRVHDVLALGQVGEADPAVLEVLGPRLRRGEARLDLLVADDAGRRRCRRGTSSRGGGGPAPGDAARARCRARRSRTRARSRPSVVTSQRPGRRPLRSRVAPTRVPSVKTMAAGPSHGSMIPEWYS